MDDLIRRSDAENIFRNARKHMKPENYSEQEFFIRDSILLGAEQIIHSIPAVDAVEVVRGKWRFEKGDGKTCVDGWVCSACNCGFHTNVPYFSEYNFCPNCGADMREEG